MIELLECIFWIAAPIAAFLGVFYGIGYILGIVAKKAAVAAKAKAMPISSVSGILKKIKRGH